MRQLWGELIFGGGALFLTTEFSSQGVLDVVMVQGSTSRGDEDNPPVGGKLVAYRQSLSEDHTFLKVLGKGMY